MIRRVIKFSCVPLAAIEFKDSICFSFMFDDGHLKFIYAKLFSILIWFDFSREYVKLACNGK